MPRAELRTKSQGPFKQGLSYTWLNTPRAVGQEGTQIGSVRTFDKMTGERERTPSRHLDRFREVLYFKQLGR